MLFKFCSDMVSRVGLAACPAMCDILEKFDDLPEKQKGIVRVITHRYLKARTFKKRQLFILMCQGKMMMNKELFDKYFKLDFLSLVGDRVPNVRIALAKALRHHFIKEISGVYITDQEFNEAVYVLKQDKEEEIRFIVSEIQLQQDEEKYKE